MKRATKGETQIDVVSKTYRHAGSLMPDIIFCITAFLSVQQEFRFSAVNTHFRKHFINKLEAIKIDGSIYGREKKHDNFRTIGSFTSLKSITLNNCRSMTGYFFENLRVLPVLRSLSLYNCDMFIDHVRSLVILTALTSLTLNNSMLATSRGGDNGTGIRAQVSSDEADLAVNLISKTMVKLDSLTLEKWPLSHKTAIFFNGMTNLTSLSLSVVGSNKMPRAASDKFFKNMTAIVPHLRELSLIGFQYNNAHTIFDFSNLKKITLK